MDKKLRRSILIIVAFGVLLYVSLNHLNVVLGFITNMGRLTLPVISGFVIAFVLNVPMKAFEKLIRWMFRKAKKQPPNKAIYIVSLVLTIICIALVITLAVTVVLPDLVDSVKSIYTLLKDKLPDVMALLEKYNIDTTRIQKWFAKFELGAILNIASSGAGEVIGSVYSFASATVSGTVTFIFALVISLYVLVSKDTVIRHTKKLVYVFLKKNIADEVCRISALTNDIYSQYLSGQCIEACILAVLITVTLAIFQIPYSGVIGLITGLFAFVPYIGAFAAGAIGAFLVLLVDPFKALVCVIIICVVQFVETQFIYPHVVGNSVGLSPLLTLVAALVGGKLMGLFGIIFFIPLTAVVYTLLREYTNKRLAEKKIKIE